MGRLDIKGGHVVYGLIFVMLDPEIGYRICVILKKCSVCDLPEIFTLVRNVLQCSFSAFLYLNMLSVSM